jgi:hypothetical protein
LPKVHVTRILGLAGGSPRPASDRRADKTCSESDAGKAAKPESSTTVSLSAAARAAAAKEAAETPADTAR